MILRCTKKLLDVIRPEQLATQEPDGDDWYGNLLVLERRKCLLLTHADILFTIIEPDVRASDLRSTHDLVAGLIERDPSVPTRGGRRCIARDARAATEQDR